MSYSDENVLIVSVAVPKPIDHLFSYRVPKELEDQIRVGVWLEVPFGRGFTHAFVVEIARELPKNLKIELKTILAVGSREPVITTDVLDLCRWMQEYYGVALGEALNCAVPPALLQAKKLEKKSPKKAKKSTGIKEGMSNPESLVDVQLTLEQQKAFDDLESARQSGQWTTALLHGVTGSGKTEVYIELARTTLAAGRAVLILVPEIALTPQLYQRFSQRLGVPIALWHSAIAQGRRRNAADAIRVGEIRVVIGARSAVFAPLQNLGLIVVDEEHDPTYKQEDRVRLNARDLAIVRGKLTRSLVVLGSATPSLETLERVREGRFLKMDLNRRISIHEAPVIDWVDLRTEEKVSDSQSPLALKTVHAIQEALDQGGQVIVYLNRRGFANFLLCRECGDVEGCPKCSVSLTVHKKRRGLHCHVCNYAEEIPQFCKKCRGTDLFAVGMGTEGLEEQLTTLISGARVLRLDRDQITSAGRLEKCLNEFRNGAANILLGTQMLVKGHDFPNVTLVVVVLADALFRWPDFRSAERAYHMLKQVAGRSGRGEKKGRVLMQTFDSDHPVLKALDGRILEETFLSDERELRQILNYPPFCRLTRIRIENSMRNDAIYRTNEIARILKSILSDESAVEMLGPSEASMERVNGKYRWDLLIKAKQVGELHRILKKTREFCLQQKWPVVIDVDPAT